MSAGGCAPEPERRGAPAREERGVGPSRAPRAAVRLLGGWCDVSHSRDVPSCEHNATWRFGNDLAARVPALLSATAYKASKVCCAAHESYACNQPRLHRRSLRATLQSAACTSSRRTHRVALHPLLQVLKRRARVRHRLARRLHAVVLHRSERVEAARDAAAVRAAALEVRAEEAAEGEERFGGALAPHPLLVRQAAEAARACMATCAMTPQAMLSLAVALLRGKRQC